jgi:hypothetical protein
MLFSEIVEANGKTIRENNMAIGHRLKLGQLVEVKYDTSHAGGACSKIHARLFIVLCGRDCDGTPLYWLASERVEGYESLPFIRKMMIGAVGGFAEGSLTPVKVTRRLRDGYGRLCWPGG